MANHWPPKGPARSRQDMKLRFAAGPRRTWAPLAGSEAPDSLYQTRATCVAGYSPICSWDAVCHATCYQIVSFRTRLAASGLWKPCPGNHSGIHRNLALAVGTIVGSPASDQEAADGGAADQAGFPGAQINPMLELEEAFHPRRVHIVRNGRATQGDGFAEYGLQSGVETIQLCPLEAPRHPAGPDPGAE